MRDFCYFNQSRLQKYHNKKYISSMKLQYVHGKNMRNESTWDFEASAGTYISVSLEFNGCKISQTPFVNYSNKISDPG